MVNNHGDQQYHLIKMELAPLAHPVLAFASEVGFALPAAVQKCRMPPQVTPAKKGKCTKMFSGIYDTNGFAWSRVLTHLKTGMFRVLLADLPFKKFLLEDPTTLLNFINLLVRTLSKCFAHSFLFMLLHRFFFQQPANPQKHMATTSSNSLCDSFTSQNTIPLALAAMTTEPLA